MTWTKTNGVYIAADEFGRLYKIERTNSSRFVLSVSPPELGIGRAVDTLRELQTTVNIRRELERTTDPDPMRESRDDLPRARAGADR